MTNENGRHAFAPLNRVNWNAADAKSGAGRNHALGAGFAPLRFMLCCALALLFLAGSPALAQERFGTISGTVTDATGARLPEVDVTIINTENKRTYTTKSGGDGSYYLQEIAPGTYSVRFTKTGFSTYEVPDATVLVGRTLRIDAPLQVGAVEQTVQVTDTAPLVDTTTTMIDHHVTAEEFDKLPKSRSYQSMVLTGTSVNTGQIEGGFQINGASGAENNYYIDGASVTSVIDGRARQDAIFEYLEEVQVKTSGMEAQYGGALGGVVSAITKSGGNDFHGEIHYYNSGSHFDAGPVRRLQLDPVNQINVGYIQDRQDDLNRHELGGSVGGRIIRDKLFFFTSFSPVWYDRDRAYLFDNGETPETIHRDYKQYNLFNKLTFEPHSRVRTNFSWLYTPTTMTGSLSGFSGFGPNWSTAPAENADAMRRLGFFQPEQSYTGSVDLTLTNTSLLSVRGGRYYLNYKDTGVPDSTYTRWMATSIGVAGVPAELQRPENFATPSTAKVLFDTTTRTYVQADFSQFVNFGGTHNFKAGIGTQKNVNKMDDSWYGPNGYVRLYWDRAFTNGERGQYGYYEVHDAATTGSVGANITHIYVQDAWRVHPRLTINAGIRLEKETIPSFQRDIQEYAFQFGYGDKIAPRLGASWDVFGTGRLKIYGSWGRYFDWTKYDLARGTFGADVWHTYYRTLDTLDVFSITADNLPGRNIWTSEYRDWRVPGFEYLDPEVKPMSADLSNIGFDWAIQPQTVFSARWVRNHLRRTIEDFGALDAEGNEVYRYGNPGEGLYRVFPSSGATCPIETPSGACGFDFPRAKRDYNALELELRRRFSGGWLANVSYVYSKLYGNYAGLQSTDEITLFGTAFSSSQNFAGDSFRPGGNANRYFDLDEALWDAKGNLGLMGRLPTDRPHVFKLYGAKTFSFGTEVGGFFRAMSGTPVTTQVYSTNHINVYVNGRGDMGRTPFFNQTDLVIAQEFRLGEQKRLRFEFNMMNLFNQKTAMYVADRLNWEEDSAAIDLSGVDLTQGFNHQQLISETPLAGTERGAYDRRFGMDTLFNPGFSGRFGVKFIF